MTNVDHALDLLNESKRWRGRRKLAEELIKITYRLEDFWPITVRRAFYRAVAQLLIENSRGRYKAVLETLTNLRREGILGWHMYQDRHRYTLAKRGYPDKSAFIRRQFEKLLVNYPRDLSQSQDVYLEISTEKDTIADDLRYASWEYCVDVNVIKGQCGADMVNDMSERFNQAYSEGKHCIMLYVGDLDPSGIAIPKALERNLLTHHGSVVEFRRVALTLDQCKEYELPEDYEAIKPKDKNLQAWIDDGYGNVPPTELDALDPEILHELVVDALNDVFDLGKLEKEKKSRRGSASR